VSRWELAVIEKIIIGSFMNKYLNVLLFLLWIFLFTSCDNSKEFRSGDIIFQISKSRQSEAIQKATNSKYSHVGLVYKNENKVYVYEAVQPVKLTPINEWINQGENKHYVVKRLKNWKESLTEDKIKKMKEVGEKFNEKSYDIYFEWSNDKIYCSELVWKMYKEALNIELGGLKTLKSFNLNDPIVKKIMKERYGNKIPYDEKVISPRDIFESKKLFTVKTGN
jgi:Permuted papain-like amidase enzyme, YaeF/YiiX, C92 family